ncbi:unnamed protein product [Oppiella nova]|uniref:Uncharacterized protein n=1 Tax=Oppiella nova TaxID=334625 RepID=A0A7R9LIM1_9ACAR|nr:unnamed protein product [Oppiella nova]CAG2163339.1 unnamed protein product [Oppiella nova]
MGADLSANHNHNHNRNTCPDEEMGRLEVELNLVFNNSLHCVEWLTGNTCPDEEMGRLEVELNLVFNSICQMVSGVDVWHVLALERHASDKGPNVCFETAFSLVQSFREGKGGNGTDKQWNHLKWIGNNAEDVDDSLRILIDELPVLFNHLIRPSRSPIFPVVSLKGANPRLKP